MKRIMMYIVGSENDKEALVTAAHFCERFGAQLRVVHPLGSATATAGESGLSGRYILAEAAPLDVVMEMRAATEKAAGIARRAYEQVCGRLDFTKWEETHETLPDAILQNCLLNDVTILERIAEEEGPEVQAFNTALFETRAPVLVTPPSEPDTVGKSVAVMWSATVQSA